RRAAHGDSGVRMLADALVLAAAGNEDAGEVVTGLREAAELRKRLADFRGAADALLAALARRPGDEALGAEGEALPRAPGGHAGLELHLAERQGEARLPIVRRLISVAEALGDNAAVDRWLAEARRLEPAVAARVDLRALARTVGGVDRTQLVHDIEAAEAR